MEAHESAPSAESLPHQHDPSLRPNNTLREKTKRPQLSCNPCRSRKVKCDRIQPCTACSLHQIAGLCQYDLTETERQPILQAEALKEKDKVIANLRRELQHIQSHSQVKMEPRDDELHLGSPHRRQMPSITPARTGNPRQRRYRGGMMSDSIYSGAPATSGVVEDFANLSVNGQPANLTHLIPRRTDMATFHTQPTNPFPTVWLTADGISPFTDMLPKDHQDIFFYLNAFQRRAQPFSYPHLPDALTEAEVKRFLGNVGENSEQHPEMLALLFATLAQGIQNAVFDKYGGVWHGGAMELECRTSNAFVAASMQCLRLSSFFSRPRLLTVETLVMMGPYLINSGRFLDAWTLFGLTVRLAQSIGLHRDPDRLNPAVPPKEAAARRSLWWGIMYMDQQYAITLGRPLAISSMGDCPPPEPLVQDPILQSLSNYVTQFTILTRQILSAGCLNATQIDDFTEQLFALKHSLPAVIHFDESWLRSDKAIPGWPLDVQATTLHAKTHTYVLLLNRQRTSEGSGNSTRPAAQPTYSSRGRRRVLQSCRAVLQAFEFFHAREPAGLVCWTTGQQAFNAAMLLVYAMIETNEATDLEVVRRTYNAFLDMQRLGIHRLAEAAVDRLGSLLKDVPSGQAPKEMVMGQSGMLLLEDPGLQGFLEGGFSALDFQKANSHFPSDRPRKQRRTTQGSRDSDGTEVKQEPNVQSRPVKPGSQRKAHVGRGSKPRPVPINKPAARPTMRQRHSGLPSPSMTEPSDRLQVSSDVTQWPLDTTSLNVSDMSQQRARISPPLISPGHQMFQGFSTDAFETQSQLEHQDDHTFHALTRAHTLPDARTRSPHHHQAGNDANMQTNAFSAQLTPHNLTPTELTPTELASSMFQTTPRLDFATYGQYGQNQMHQQTPMHTPPFSATFPSGEMPCSYPGQY